jgi:hypothetical protein
MSHRIKIACIAAVAAALTLSACNRSDDDELARLDNEIAGNESDPALTSALQDQILVDPTLSQQSNRNAVRSAESPTQAQYPGGRRDAGLQDGCGNDFDTGSGWANRLPAAFGIYPKGRLTDAAGNARNGCRVVTFVSADAPDTILGWYESRATGAGYTAERQGRGEDQILAGTNERTGGAYFLIVTPRGSGADVALIANNGR